MIIAPWRLSAWHIFIDAKYSTWSNISDANPPEGDTKPPEGDNPWSLFIISSILFSVTILFLDSRLDRLRICRLSWHLFKVLRILNSFFLILDPRRLDNLKDFWCQISLSSPLNTCTLFCLNITSGDKGTKKVETKL